MVNIDSKGNILLLMIADLCMVIHTFNNQMILLHCCRLTPLVLEQAMVHQVVMFQIMFVFR